MPDARRPTPRRRPGPARGLLLAVAALLAVAVGGCETQVATHGDPLDAEELARIQPGVHTRDDVARLIGSPSSVPLFDPSAWYYISNRQETIAFLAPDTIERQVVTIRFDDRGVVSAIDRFGLERGETVEIVSRETPSFGQAPNVFQQLMGNLGRFNREGAPGGGGGPGGP
jgi:outer membrane protein assembly factor BamE (lipoprotein component of BamABCDE complex)